MTGPDDGPTDEQEAVGSVAEEAAKLFSALQGWAKETGAGHAADAASAAAGMGARWEDLNRHIATGGADCTYCPLCQLIGVVRQTSPEVRTHLSVAASSLFRAAAGLLETQAGAGQRRGPGVEKIDLDDPDGDGSGVEWDAD